MSNTNQIIHKVCSKCNEEKPLLDCFRKQSSNKDDYQKVCKVCMKLYYEENKKEIVEKEKTKRDNLSLEEKESKKQRKKEYDKKYNEENKDKRKEQSKEYREENKESKKEYDKKYNEENKEKKAEQSKEWQENNREKSNEIKNRWRRNKKQNDIGFKISQVLRKRLNRAIKKNQGFKSGKSDDLLGCSYEKVIQHLEDQFTEGMTWENHGFEGWHIDHIKPCSVFDLTDPEEQKKCFHFSNLQPLWASENLSKGAKWDNDDNILFEKRYELFTTEELELEDLFE
jgi:hypothetical protein